MLWLFLKLFGADEILFRRLYENDQNHWPLKIDIIIKLNIVFVTDKILKNIKLINIFTISKYLINNRVWKLCNKKINKIMQSISLEILSNKIILTSS